MGFKIGSPPGSTGSNTQSNLDFTPENVANKSTSVVLDQVSNTKYPSVKSVYDWVTSAISGFATQAWVNTQGFVTNVITALGFTPENVANKSTSVTTDQASNTKYPSVKAVYDELQPRELKAVNDTGSLIRFDSPRVYNTLGSPGNADITVDLTGARIGVVQKIYHNKLVAPTFPVDWVLLGYYPYKAGSNNIIYAEWVGGSRVEYWIVRL